jgi:molybdopterin converting factor subunit 1
VKYRIRLFAAIRQRLGAEAIEIECPSPCNAGELQTRLAAEHPAAAELIRQSRMAVNAAYAAPNRAVTPQDEIALIPPVSGG